MRKAFHSNSKKLRFEMVNALLYLVFLFAFFLVVIVGYKTFTELNNDIQTDDYLSVENKAIVDSLHSRYVSVFDGIFVFLLFMCYILSVFLAYTANNSPLLFVVAIIFSLIVLVVGFLLGNAYHDLSQDAQFVDSYNEFTMAKFIFENQMAVIITFIMSVMVALFVGSRN